MSIGMGLLHRLLKKRGEAVQERYVAPFRPLLREDEHVIQVAVARDPNGDPRELIHLGPTNQKRLLWYYKDEPSRMGEINLAWLEAAGMNSESLLVALVEAPMHSSQLALGEQGYTKVLFELLPSALSAQVMVAIVEQIGGPEKMQRLSRAFMERYGGD
ncbi:MAG: hypothetical protein WEB06_02045 [Actinomycetota bacterium]